MTTQIDVSHHNRTANGLLRALQHDLPVRTHLALLCAADSSRLTTPAQELVLSLNAHEQAVCQTSFANHAAALTALRSRWQITICLAVLLAVTVIGRAFEVGLSPHGTVVLSAVLIAILAPACIIHVGMAYELAATHALLHALRALKT
jgi:hypothetical protein